MDQNLPSSPIVIYGLRRPVAALAAVCSKSGLRAPTELIVAAFAATIAFHPVLVADAAEPQRIVVEIRKFAFVPQIPALSAGDVVVWKNLDIVPHTATAKDESWDSSTIEAGGEWQIVVTEEMLGDYFCRFHPSMVAALDIGIE